VSAYHFCAAEVQMGRFDRVVCAVRDLAGAYEMKP